MPPIFSCDNCDEPYHAPLEHAASTEPGLCPKCRKPHWIPVDPLDDNLRVRCSRCGKTYLASSARRQLNHANQCWLTYEEAEAKALREDAEMEG